MKSALLVLLLTLASAPANAQPPIECAKRGSPCHVDTRLSMAGIEDTQDARAFLKELKQAATNDDRSVLAELIAYPVKVFADGKQKTYKTPSALLSDFDAVFTPGVLEAIERAEYRSLFVNAQGAMMGSGEIWFDGWTGDVLIKSINAD